MCFDDAISTADVGIGSPEASTALAIPPKSPKGKNFEKTKLKFLITLFEFLLLGCRESDGNVKENENLVRLKIDYIPWCLSSNGFSQLSLGGN